MKDFTKQDLLSIDKIAELITDKPLQDQLIILNELKEQAAELKIVRIHNEAVKAAKEQVFNKLMKKQAGTPIDDAPDVITNFAGYNITEMGVSIALNKSLLEICPYPIFITERYTDIDDGTEKVKIEFKRDGVWHNLVLPRATIANASKIVQLADMATGITSENAKAVVKYLSDIESANRYSLIPKLSVSRLGWTEYGFVPFIDDIIYTGSDTYSNLYKKFHESGKFEAWCDVSKKCLQYPIPRIIIAASYASLLLNHIGVNGFCVHVWGESGRGKTVALMLGASIYGDPDPKSGIIRNGKTTSNGIEPVLAFFNNCPVYFDELTTLTQEQITDMIYKFAQGQGKGRMTKNATLQKSFTWNNVAIMSAEKPLVDSKTMSGAVNRVISIYTEGSVFGDMNMVELVKNLEENYGFGAKLFIEALKEVDISAIYNKYINNISDKIEQKQANAAAVLLTAYEIAAKYVYGIENEMTVESLSEFLVKKNEVSVSARAYSELISWVSANYTFFDDSSINQSKWGRAPSLDKEKPNGPLANREDKNLIHVFYTRFVEWCQKNGYQEKAILREWRNKGLLKTRNKNELKNNAKVKGILYSDVITVVKNEDVLQETMEELTPVDDVLPF